MRYPLAGRFTVAQLTKGSGWLAGALGVARGWGKRALSPMAVPVAIGAGLVWLGRSFADSYVDIGYGRLHIRLGVLFDEAIPLSAIESVRESTWTLIGGLGLRTDMRGTLAVTTKAGPVAEITLKEPRKLPLIPKLWRIDAHKIVVSPEDLQTFIADLQAELETTD